MRHLLAGTAEPASDGGVHNDRGKPQWPVRRSALVRRMICYQSSARRDALRRAHASNGPGFILLVIVRDLLAAR
jgi:hypothetical protein